MRRSRRRRAAGTCLEGHVSARTAARPRAGRACAAAPGHPRYGFAAVRTTVPLLACLTLGAAACSSKLDDVRGSNAYITDVQFVGNKRFSEDQILGYLHMGETSRLPWKDKFAYLPGVLPVDADRIVELYRAHGYYDAEVLAITPDVKAGKIRLFARTPGERRPGKAKIRVEIREGEPTRVREIAVVWPEGRPRGPDDRALTDDALEDAITLKRGKAFEIPGLNTSVEALRTALQERGYAYAEVKETARVEPGVSADVRFEVRPGPYVKIDKIRLQGLRKVPEYFVRNELDFARGRPYAKSIETRVEKSVYAMEVFDTVAVVKDDKPKGDGTVDLEVQVREAKPQTIKVGPGFGFDPIRWEQRVTMLYTHRNLGKTLTRLDLRVQAGYAELPSLLRPTAHGPIFKIEPAFRQKGLIEKHTTATLAPAFELGIWEGYQFYTPTFRAGLSRFFFKRLQAELTYNFRFVDFFNVSPTLDRDNNEVLGRDFRDPYMLSYIEPALHLYLTDSVLAPKNGAVLGVIYDLAGLGGYYSFHRVRPSVRAYWTPHWRFTLAGRAEVGFIVPYGAKAGTPIDMKFYLGGADSVRGWGLRRLSPQVFEEGCFNDPEGCRGIPVGGNTLVLANIEARIRATKMLSFAAFLDAGDVQPGVADFKPRRWNYSAGPGVRLDTPIGIFRLDLGLRLNDTPYAYGQRVWALHFGLGEAF